MTLSHHKQFVLRCAARTVLLYVSFLVISSLVYKAGFSSLSAQPLANGIFTAIQLPLITLVMGLLPFPLVFFTVAHTFLCNDSVLRTQCRTAKFDTSEWILHSQEFRIGAAILAALVLLLPPDVGFSKIFTVLTFLPWNFILKKLCQLLLILPLILLLYYFSYRAAVDTWLQPQRINREKKWGTAQLIRQLIVKTILYTLTFACLPIAAQILLPILYLVGTPLWRARWTVLVILAVLLLWFYLRAVRIRAKFLYQLRKIASDKRSAAHISHVRYPFLSMFFPLHKTNFSVTIREKQYSVRLLSDVLYLRTMCFGPYGSGIKHSSLMINKAEFFQTDIPFTYAFDGDGEKILVITPIPKFIMFADNGHAVDLDVGDQIGEYRIFNASGFIGMLKRDCLDRKITKNY